MHPCRDPLCISPLARIRAHKNRSVYHPSSLRRKQVHHDRRNYPGPTQLFTYVHDASRLELLIRIVYWILIAIVVWVYGIITFICLFIQWFHILIFGTRHEGLSNFAKGYLEYLVHVMATHIS